MTYSGVSEGRISSVEAEGINVSYSLRFSLTGTDLIIAVAIPLVALLIKAKNKFSQR